MILTSLLVTTTKSVVIGAAGFVVWYFAN